MSDEPAYLRVAKEHAQALTTVDGVVAVTVGGSHGGGYADEHSDLDLGVYYRAPLDVAALRSLATAIAGRPTEVAAPGEWGPWVNGGAWLDLDGGRVDWILRDLDRVQGEWDRARRGEFSLHHQAGHPFGFVSTTYVAEVANARIVADPTGELTALRTAAQSYPAPLAAAFTRWLWEAGFSLDVAAKAAGRGDAAYVGMCLVHAVGIMAHAVLAHAGTWVTNEKGIVDRAGRAPTAPPDFAARGHGVCAGGGDPEALSRRLREARALLDDVRAVLADAQAS